MIDRSLLSYDLYSVPCLKRTCRDYLNHLRIRGTSLCGTSRSYTCESETSESETCESETCAQSTQFKVPHAQVRRISSRVTGHASETRSSVRHAAKGHSQDSPGQSERRSREALPRADRSSARYPMLRRKLLRRGETGTIGCKEKAPPDPIFNGPGYAWFHSALEWPGRGELAGECEPPFATHVGQLDASV